MFKNFELTITYTISGTTKTVKTSHSLIHEDFTLQITPSDSTMSITLNPLVTLELEAAFITTPLSYAKSQLIFANGYQSWTDSQELPIHAKMPGINHIPSFMKKKFAFESYGDYYFYNYPNKKGRIHSFSYTYLRSDKHYDLIGSIDERSGYTLFEHNTPKNILQISKDVAHLVLNQTYQLFQLVQYSGDYDTVFDLYFKAMDIKKPTCQPMAGYTSWYNHYQNINQSIITTNLESLAAYSPSLDIFQIDDGYQTHVGDWLSIDATKFPNGMKPMADLIHSKNKLAGIWLAPFACETNSIIFKEHKEWLLKDSNGQYILSGHNWSGFYALNLEHPEVKTYLRHVFHVVLKEWGYDLVKLDFLYAACLSPIPQKTRGQVMFEAMDFLRECVGDKLILGCGVPLAPAFGKVDYCRIGTDIGLDWNDKPYMRLLHRERVSTKNAITNTLYRRHLDGRGFLNDPDVFLLRDTNIQLSTPQKILLTQINGLFGSLLFTSDDLNTYGTDQKKAFADARMLQRAENIEITEDALDVTINFTLDDSNHVIKFNKKKGELLRSLSL